MDARIAPSARGLDAAGLRLPDEPRLAEVAAELARVRLAAELFDPCWRMVWISDELKGLVGEQDEVRIGYGQHVLLARTNELWSGAATEASQREWARANLPYVLHETPPEILAEIPPPPDERILAEVEPTPAPAPAAWSYELIYQRPGFPPRRINCLAIRLADESGERIGTANVYAPGLPATIVDLLSRGDEEMIERMSRLIEPGRRQAAILFADLQSSGTLSRRLPSAEYFRLIRALTTAIDDVVGEFGGVVGKHAGDGVTAFFLAEDLGSTSRAARAAIEAARGIATAGRLAAAGAGDGGLVEAGDVVMNIGLHWGGALYMGQVVTGGRLEVTALGDEVNEAARLQQSAREGAALASKALLERLEGGDARALELDPDRILYRTVAELPGADPKAVRDAGGIPVAELGTPRA